MKFVSIQKKINSLSGHKARQVIYKYLNGLNKGTRRGTRHYTTQRLTDCGRGTEEIEVFKMGEKESTIEKVFIFHYKD